VAKAFVPQPPEAAPSSMGLATLGTLWRSAGQHLPREFDEFSMLLMARIDRVQREGKPAFRHLG
jgi:hypothetical protein